MRTSTSRMSFRGRANNARRRAFQPANYFKLESLKDRTLLAAGVLSSTSISGQKWNDLNGDALHDANEPGLNGWVINVLDAAQNLIATTTTASVDLNGDGSINPVTEQGLYTVEVPPGDWVVQEETRAGWVETSPSSQAALTAAQLDAAVDLRTTQNDFLDWGHLNEKWLLGNDGWYFITPDGALSKWNLSPRTAIFRSGAPSRENCRSKSESRGWCRDYEPVSADPASVYSESSRVSELHELRTVRE